MEQMQQTAPVQTPPEEKKKKKKWLLLLLLLLVLLAIAGAIVGIVLSQPAAEDEGTKIQKEWDAKVGILPGMSEEEIQDRLTRVVAESRLNVSMNPKPVFKDGRSKGNLRIENIQGNNYGFTVELQVIATSDDPGAADFIGQTVLKTGVIEQGSYLEEKQLDVVLPKGEYVCVANFTAYNAELEEIGQTGMQILITVEA